MVSNIPFGSYQPELKDYLKTYVLLDFRLEFPKSDLTIYLPSGISEIFCQMVSSLFSGSQKEFDRLVSSKICSTTRWEDITSWPNSYNEDHGNFEINVSL